MTFATYIGFQFCRPNTFKDISCRIIRFVGTANVIAVAEGFKANFKNSYLDFIRHKPPHIYVSPYV